MLGNLIGGFIVNKNCTSNSNIILHNPSVGSNSLRGQDRGVNDFSYAVETKKGNHEFGWIYSPNFEYKMKSKINIMNFSWCNFGSNSSSTGRYCTS